MAKRFKDLSRTRKERLISKAGFGPGAGKRAAAAYNQSLPKPAKIEQAPLLPGKTYESNKAFQLPGAMKKTGTGVTAPPATPTPAKIKQAPLLPGQTFSKSGAFNLRGVRTPASGTGVTSLGSKSVRGKSDAFGGITDAAAPLTRKEVGGRGAAGQGGGATTTQPYKYDPGYQLSFDGKSFDEYKDFQASRYMMPGREGGDPRPMTDRQRARKDVIDPLSDADKKARAIFNFSQGDILKAAQRAGVSNMNSEKDINQIYNELMNPSTGMQTAGQTGKQGPRDKNRIQYKQAINKAIADGTLSRGEIASITDQFGYSRKNLMKVSEELFGKNYTTQRPLAIEMGKQERPAGNGGRGRGGSGAEGGGPKVEGTDPESLIQMLLAGIAASNQAQALNQRLGSVTPQFQINPFNMQGIGAFRSRADQFGAPSPFMGLSQIAS